MAELPEDLRRSLIAMNILTADQSITAEALTGGVASELWRIDLPGSSVCVKRALEQLKVAGEWQVSVDRNACEVAWFKRVATIVPEAVPEIVGHDAQAGVFAMEYLPPEHYPVWKAQLREGIVNSETIWQLAQIVGQIHQVTAGDDTIARQFDNDDLFYNLRLDPYLHYTAEHHLDVKDQLVALAASVLDNKKALIHGDISPKNILVGQQGPIILDAECACYGDPAFDVAFCLNHFLLKCIWNPGAITLFIEGADFFVDSYLTQMNWEPPEEFLQRVAALLPGLMLGRIDGKSPVEYIVNEFDRLKVRKFAKRFLYEPVNNPQVISRAWLLANK